MRDDGGNGPAEAKEEVEVLVCRKCLVRGGARSGGVDLPRWLQGAFAERGLSEQVRVLPTGCMNQCPRGQVTVLVTSGDGRGGSMLMVDPRLQREKLVQLVERKARGLSVPPVEDTRGAESPMPFLRRRVGVSAPVTDARGAVADPALPAEDLHGAGPRAPTPHEEERRTGSELLAPAGDDRGNGP